MRGRKFLVYLLSLALIIIAVLTYDALVPGKQAQIGMTLHYRGADPASIRRQFDLMAAMKVNWIRVDIDWSAIESERGEFDWSYSDLIVDEAAARKMNVLGVLGFTPTWARTSASSDSANPRHFRPDDLAHYANFARLAAERYAPEGVHSWEIWNEHNTSKFWPPLPDANEYGQLFRGAATAIRSVDVTTTLLIGGLGPQYEEPGAEIPPTTYLEQLYDNGTAQLADGIASHPYSFPALPAYTSPQPVGGFKDLPKLHAVMAEHGDGHKKIWITEFGAPTGTDPWAVSEECQAVALLQARQQVARWDWTGPLIFYELVDGGDDPADKEQNFGVLREDLSPKPSAIALTDIAPS